MSNTIIYDQDKHSTREIFELHSQGVKILCPRCKSELLVLPDYEASGKYKKHPGIYCPKNENHVGVRLFISTVRDRVWSQFYQLRQKRLEQENL